MKILQVHVRHREPGGSEVLFDALVDLLRARGHEVATLEPDNRQIEGVRARAAAALTGIYSPRSYGDMKQILGRERPEVVHAHNLYPLLSPSVVRACNDAGVPIVMSLHDYKLICPTAQYFREGSPCHRCSGGKEYHCVLANCRSNLLESAAYAARTAVARRAGWITSGIDRFIACSDFVRRRYVAEGFPGERIEVLPNFAEMPAVSRRENEGSHAGFIGRLSPEKGITTLLEAARLSGIPVRVAGGGAMGPAGADPPPNVEFVGRIVRGEVGAFFHGLRFLVVPSLFEEPFGIVAAEAMGHGVPVIASNTGGLPEIVEDGVTGYLVEPGDSTALAMRMRQLWEAPQLARRLGEAARQRAVAEFTGETYCTRLEQIYHALVRPPFPTATAQGAHR